MVILPLTPHFRTHAMLTRKIPLLFKAPALFAVFAAGLCLAPSAAVAGECDRIAEVARQNAALYRDSGDPHHRAAAQAQQKRLQCVRQFGTTARRFGRSFVGG